MEIRAPQPPASSYLPCHCEAPRPALRFAFNEASPFYTGFANSVDRQIRTKFTLLF